MEQMTKNTSIVGTERKGLVDSLSSSSLSCSGNLSGSSLESESDSFEEVTSSSSSPSSSTDHQLAADSLHDMSSLFQQLPIKRGLSKHYQGKSQSFTSLANVRSLEDLAKPENPYNKKLKSCRRSYGGGLMGETHNRATKCSNSNALSRQISTSPRVLCSPSVKRASANLCNTSRPPMPPHRSTSTTTTISNQTPLFSLCFVFGSN